MIGTQFPWYVLTGGPSSGKTTLLGALEDRGYATIPESARIIYNDPSTPKSLFSNMLHKQETFAAYNLYLQLSVEDRAKLHFLDRAIPDNLAYLEFSNTPASDLMHKFSTAIRYKGVFVLEPVPYEPDPLRPSEEDCARLLQLTIEIYKKLGYDPIMVPLMPVEDRIDYILEKITNVFEKGSGKGQTYNNA